MPITMEPATPDSLAEVVEAVATWQVDGVPVQLHPGDLGWQWRLGSEETARTVRLWRRDGEVLAAGLIDGVGLIRVALSPSVDEDGAFAAELVDQLPPELTLVEARYGAALRERLASLGWVADEPWTPLVRDLADPVEDCGIRVEVTDEHSVEDRITVQRAAFPTSRFTVEQWAVMAATPAYERARCLVGYDGNGAPVAGVTVWSAGEGRPGLLEPMGVSQEHRGHGYGTAICVAAAAALRDLGSSSATVCTMSSNVGGVATYAAAGYRSLGDVTDFRNPG